MSGKRQSPRGSRLSNASRHGKPWRPSDCLGLANGSLYFYVGAGLSMGAGLVGWEEMTATVFAYLRTREQDNVKRRLAQLSSAAAGDKRARIQGQILAEFLEQRDKKKERLMGRDSTDPRALGRAVLLNLMLRYRKPAWEWQVDKSRLTRGTKRRARPGEEPSAEDLCLHSLLWRAKCHGILTTNYDMLLEHAFSVFAHGAALRSYRYSADLLRYLLSNRQFVLKLHGDINDLGGMLLDPQQAWTRRAALSTRKQGQNLKRVYAACLERGHMVYVGCGFRDETIKHLHAFARQRSHALNSGHCRLALLPLDVFRSLRSLWSELFGGITCVTFKKNAFAEVRTFLERIVDARAATHVPAACQEATELREAFFRASAGPGPKRWGTSLWTCISKPVVQ